MAIVTKPGIGMISGQLGEFIYRVRNGKLVQYRKPVKVNVSRSVAAESARRSFAQLVRFAVFINSFPALKQIWQRAKVPGSNHYQKIIRNNASAATSSGISVRNIITPPGIPVEIDHLNITDSKISFRVPVHSDKLKRLYSKQTSVYLLLYFHKPLKKGASLSSINSIIKYIESNKTSFTAELELSPEIISNMKKYKRVLVFIAAISGNIHDQKIYWTSTYSEEIEL